MVHKMKERKSTVKGLSFFFCIWLHKPFIIVYNTEHIILIENYECD